MTAASAASIARQDMYDAFGETDLAPGKYLWRDVPASAGAERLVIGLSDQLAYLYRGTTLMAVATISSGEPITNFRCWASTPKARRVRDGRPEAVRWKCRPGTSRTPYGRRAAAG